MRVVIIFLLLVVLGYIGWKAVERLKIIDTPQEQSAQTPSDSSVDEEPEAAAEPSLPSFDVVRIDRTGYAVIAGRAKPGSKVTIYANGEELISETTEGDGSWVVATDTPLDAGPVELRLSMTLEDGTTIHSEQSVLIYVPERAGDVPLVLRTTPGAATEVLQDPRDMPDGLGPLTLDVIDYDDSGAVIFSGRAEPGRMVQLFISGRGFDRQPLGQVLSSEQGRWLFSPEAQIAPGVYQLLVVQLDERGRPKYAIELPFERARPDQIEIRDGKVIVQPGNSLWRIARRAYGQGAQYTIIYEANEDQIRDPDLIYPGQIFEVPDTEEGAEEETAQ